MNLGFNSFYFSIKSLILALLLLSSPLLLASLDNLEAKEHTIFSTVLKKHVNNGWVNYKALKKNKIFLEYIKQLENTNHKKIKNKKRKLAFWINAYNAYTLKLIIDNYPLKSINELHTAGGLMTIWKKWKFKIYKKEYSLDQIEHKIIRANYKEPRVHAALVCAAKSCPPLRSEAYEGKNLDEQLDLQMQDWLRNTKLNYLNEKKRTLQISQIFKWFKKDFNQMSEFSKLKKAEKKKRRGIPNALIPYFKTAERNKIYKLIENKKLKVRYLKYDWSLNGI